MPYPPDRSLQPSTSILTYPIYVKYHSAAMTQPRSRAFLGKPALPGVTLGHNEHAGWGFTIVQYDQIDLYIPRYCNQRPLRRSAARTSFSFIPR